MVLMLLADCGAWRQLGEKKIIRDGKSPADYLNDEIFRKYRFKRQRVEPLFQVMARVKKLIGAKTLRLVFYHSSILP